MADAYDPWRRMLAGERIDITDEPLPGFYRARRSKQEKHIKVGVAIWLDPSGKLMCLKGSEMVPPHFVWPYCTKEPITEEAYREWARTGKWPDIDEAVQSPPAPPGEGHNLPPDEVEILKDQIESAKAGAEKYAEIADDETAKAAQSLRARLLELSGEADKKREAEKKPHLEAGKAVDAKWQPLVKSAKAVADQVRAAIAAWETKKLRVAREVEEKRRKALEELAKLDAPLIVDAPESAPAAMEIHHEQGSSPALKPAPVKGGYGKAASVSVVKIVEEITDHYALFQFLWDRPEFDNALHEILLEQAQRAVDKGMTPPGVKIEERAKIR